MADSSLTVKVHGKQRDDREQCDGQKQYLQPINTLRAHHLSTPCDAGYSVGLPTLSWIAHTLKRVCLEIAPVPRVLTISLARKHSVPCPQFLRGVRAIVSFRAAPQRHGHTPARFSS